MRRTSVQRRQARIAFNPAARQYYQIEPCGAGVRALLYINGLLDYTGRFASERDADQFITSYFSSDIYRLYMQHRSVNYGQSSR